MRIITCASYYHSGSSAVTDFFSEFDHCYSLGQGEFRFAHEPDGLSALEHNIVENNHRHNTSHAIKRFIRYSKIENGNFLFKRYRNYFDDNYMPLTMQYVRDITQLEHNTVWRGDKMEKGDFFYTLDSMISAVSRHLGGTTMLSLLWLGNVRGYYTAIGREEFYAATKKYTRALFEIANRDHSPYLTVDQLVPPSNTARYLNYFDDVKVITVDRDPRDLFIEVRCNFRERVMPERDVEAFCKWFRITREHRKHDAPHPDVMFIHLEDLIYHYDETAKRIMEHTGLTEEEHVRKFTKFIPEKSMKNTKHWLRHPELAKEVAYIEEHLPEYLYPYDD